MNKNFRTMQKFFVLSAALVALAGCGVKTAPDVIDYENVAVADSLELGGSKAVSKVSAVYPVGQTALADSVREWICGKLGCDGSGLTVADAAGEFVKSTLAEAKSDFEGFQEEGFAFTYGYQVAVDTLFSSPALSTYASTFYAYIGGAHGMSAYTPATFLSSDGVRLTWGNTLRPGCEAQMVELIKRGLDDQYFRPNGMSLAIGEGLLVDPDSIGLPSAAPFITSKGLQVIYQQYEIAPYAAGMPACALPLDSVMPLLTSAMQSALK